MFINAHNQAVELINNFVVETPKDEKRLKKAIERVNQNALNGFTDAGIAGKVKEILHHDSDSTIYDVRTQNKCDGYFVLDGKRKPLEHKINGGRIEKLYHIRNKENAYIAYMLDFVPPTRKLKDGSLVFGVRRYTNKVMTVKSFLDVIESTGAVKIAKHNNKTDAERAVQVSSKKLYLALVNGNFADFDRNKTYLSANIK